MKRKLRFIQVVLVLALFLLSMPFAAFAASGTDQTILVNTPVTDNLSSSSEQDIFRFNLKEPGSIQVKFDYPSDASNNTWKVSLYGVDSDGKLQELQSSSNKDSSSSVNATKTMYLDKSRLPAGDYYVLVRISNYYSYSNANYTVTPLYISESGSDFEKEYNNSSQRSNTINTNSPCTGNLSKSSDTDWFKVTMAQPGSLQVKFDYPSDASNNTWKVSLYEVDSDGKLQELQSSSNKDSSSSVNATKTMYLDKSRLPAGDYYVLVRISNYYSYSNADYTVTPLYTPEPGSDFEKELNNSSQTANTINTNSPCTGNHSKSGDTDWFKVTMAQPGSLQVKFDYPSDASNSTWDVILYGVDSDSKLQELQSSSNKDSSASVNATKTMYLDKSRLPAGDYYVLVRISNYYSYSNADYTLTVLSDISADIPASWAKTEVETAINKQLIPKDMQKLYAQNINRKDFCYLVINLITIKTGKNINEILISNGKTLDYSIFSDTNDPTILAANALGIVGGKGNNKFDPNGNITRQEAAVMLQRTASVLGFIVPNGPPVNFSDKSKFSSWAVNGIAFASAATDKTNNNKVMGGTGNDNFTPQGTYTRQQAFITMIRLFNAMD